MSNIPATTTTAPRAQAQAEESSHYEYDPVFTQQLQEDEDAIGASLYFGPSFVRPTRAWAQSPALAMQTAH